MTDTEARFKEVCQAVPTYVRRRPFSLNHLSDDETCAAGYHAFRVDPETLHPVGGCRTCGTPFVRDAKNW